MTRYVAARRPGQDVHGSRQVFVAVPLPSSARKVVADLVERVRADGADRRGRDVRWVRLDGLHVTLRFLGPTPESEIPSIKAAIRGAVSDIESFRLVVDGAGAFPSTGRPRAIFLDIVDGAPFLSDLARRIDDALVPLGWPVSDRPFRAHLTLARSDGVAAGPAVAARLAEAARGLDLRATIDRVGVFESLTGDGPARYEPLELVSLA